MMILHPAGANGVALKSNWPLIMEYADNFGWIFDFWSMLSVITACGSSRSQSFDGYVGSVPLRIEIKWALNVLIARSAGLSLWSPGDTS